MNGQQMVTSDLVKENLEQIQDNSHAIGAITRALNFIALTQVKPRCETCGEWHDKLSQNGMVADLHTAITALSQYSDLLAHEISQVSNDNKEEDALPESK